MEKDLGTRNDDVELEEYLELSPVDQKSKIIFDDKRIVKKKRNRKICLYSILILFIVPIIFFFIFSKKKNEVPKCENGYCLIRGKYKFYSFSAIYTSDLVNEKIKLINEKYLSIIDIILIIKVFHLNQILTFLLLGII